MRYRKTSTITAKYPGKCACCGGHIYAGERVDYNSAKREITHEDGIRGKCFSVLNQQANGPLPRDHGFVDIDRAYEDQCADICGR